MWYQLLHKILVPMASKLLVPITEVTTSILLEKLEKADAKRKASKSGNNPTLDVIVPTDTFLPKSVEKTIKKPIPTSIWRT